MRQEKQVKQLQLINVHLLFYGHGKQMDAHGKDVYKRQVFLPAAVVLGLPVV